jgi:FAD/FMN-containing dehydrogenase
MGADAYPPPGGLSYYSGEYGLAADNVESFEVVLADGRMVTASRDQESDLFWALKGGGPNFGKWNERYPMITRKEPKTDTECTGIVTGYNIHTIPVKNIWYTLSIYSLDQASTILDAFAAWQSSNTDPKASVVFYFSLQAVTLGLIYNEHAERPAAFQQFYALPPALVTAVPESNGTAYTLNQITAAVSTGQPTAPR